MYHPDKHNNELKDIANSQFQKIQKAYESNQNSDILYILISFIR